MSPLYDVYAIGNALVDTEFVVSDAFLAEHGIAKSLMTLVPQAQQLRTIAALTASGEPRKRASGGSAANTAMTVQGLGGQSYYSCRVADDDTGAFYVNDLLSAGVGTNMHSHRPQGVSGTCLVMVTPDAERTMNTFLGISEQVSVDDLDEQALVRSRWVYLEGYLVTSPSGRAAAIRLRELAEQHGVKVAMTLSDPSMVQLFRDGLSAMLGAGVDLLFCNEDEARQFTGTDSAEAALQALSAVARQVVVTCGARGALIFDSGTIHAVSGVPTQAVDTNGAGDTFAGAFLYAVARGRDVQTAGTLACHAASQVVSDFGPRLSGDALRSLRSQVLGE